MDNPSFLPHHWEKFGMRHIQNWGGVVLADDYGGATELRGELQTACGMKREDPGRLQLRSGYLPGVVTKGKSAQFVRHDPKATSRIGCREVSQESGGMAGWSQNLETGTGYFFIGGHVGPDQIYSVSSS